MCLYNKVSRCDVERKASALENVERIPWVVLEIPIFIHVVDFIPRNVSFLSFLLNHNVAEGGWYRHRRVPDLSTFSLTETDSKTMIHCRISCWIKLKYKWNP